MFCVHPSGGVGAALGSCFRLKQPQCSRRKNASARAKIQEETAAISFEENDFTHHDKPALELHLICNRGGLNTDTAELEHMSEVMTCMRRSTTFFRAVRNGMMSESPPHPRQLKQLLIELFNLVNMNCRQVKFFSISANMNFRCFPFEASCFPSTRRS